MAENTNIGLTVEAWGDIVIKEWVSKARMLGVAPDHPISVDRFVSHVVTQANGDPRYIEFAFDYYLKFINWGVGKGVNLDDRDMMVSSGFTSRRPLPWYDDVFFKQLAVLGHLMAEKYKQKAIILVKTNIEQNPTK